MKKDPDSWLWVLPCMPLTVWVIGMTYVFFPLSAALLVSAVALVTAGAATGAVMYRRRISARRRDADAQLERARWALMTHLTEADERWLAERHFWVVPVEVARLRAGLDPQPEWRSLFEPPAELRQLMEMRSRSEAAHAAFEGIRRTQQFIESEPVEGEPIPAFG